LKLEWKTCLKVGVSVFLLYLCIHYWQPVMAVIGEAFGAAAPLLIGCIVAYPINILMSFYERKFFPRATKKGIVAVRRPICMLLAIITLLAVIALIMILIVPQLISCVQVIFAELPDAIRNVVSWLDKYDFLPDNILDKLMEVDWNSRIGQIIEVLTSGIGSVVEVVVNAITSVFSGIVTALISVIFAVYLLSSKEKLKRQSKALLERYIGHTWRVRILYVLAVMDDCFHRYIVGQCIEAVILGALCAIGMAILRLPYATMIGALIAFTALIPIAGAYIGAAVGAFMILTVSPMKALIFLVFLVILQQLEGNIIYPRVVGSSMGLPGIWVLAAVTVGGGMMGIAGMLIGVPLAATVYRLVREDVRRGKEAVRILREPDPVPPPPPPKKEAKPKGKTVRRMKISLKKNPPEE